MFKYLIVLLVFYTCSFSKILDVSNPKNLQTLEYISFINDSLNSYSYEDINKKEDLESLKIKHIGGAVGPFWTKLNLINNSTQTKQITLYNPLAGINKIDVYLLKENHLIKTLKLGDLRNQDEKETLSTYSSFNLVLNPNESITVISKIENFHIYNLVWEILETNDFFTKDSQKIFYSGFIGGIVLLFCLYNILNFILYKNKSYLIICAIALSLSFYQYGFHGIFYFLNIGINLELITAMTWNSSLFGGIFLLLFAFIFFEQYTKYRKNAYLNLFFMFAYFLLVLLVSYAQYFDETYYKYSWLISLVVLLSTLYLFTFAIYMVIKKEVGSKYYILGEGILFVSVFFNTLGLFNLISYVEIIKFLIPFAYMINMIFLVIALYLKNKIEQENLKKAKILLLEQSRFNSIGQAIGHVSHQWKNPLTKVGTSITLLETVYNHDQNRFIETFEKQLPLMKNSVKLMKKSMDEFSNFYQTKSEKEIFSLFESISNITEILSSKITLKRVKIDLQIPKEFELESYEHILSNVFLILIDNSLDAFPQKEDNNIVINAKKENKKIIIYYEDNAGGIKIKPIESVFDYFVSSKENKKSSGIGLAVAKMLINDRLNGEISVKNKEKGVIFTIII